MIDRQTFTHRTPHQRGFITFDDKQITLHHVFLLLARVVRQCGGAVAFAVDFGIKPLDQRITMQPYDQRKHIMRFSEPNRRHFGVVDP